MRGQDLPSAPLTLVDNAADLFVYDLCRRVRDVLALGDRVAEEHLLFVFAVAQRSELLAETELGDHPARQIGRPANIVGGPRRDLVRPKDQLFGNPTTKQTRDHRLDLDLGLAVLVALREEHGDAERATARD